MGKSCEFILNLDKWFSRCHLKKSLHTTDGQMDAGRRPITIAQIEPSAQVSLKQEGPLALCHSPENGC